MQKILRNGSVLTYSTAHTPCIALTQRRFVSRNTAIHRGLRRGEGRSQYPKTWEDRPYQRQQDVRERTSSYGDGKKTWEKKPDNRGQGDGEGSRSYGDGKRVWEKKSYNHDQGDRENTRAYGDGERTWEKRPYQGGQDSRGKDGKTWNTKPYQPAEHDRRSRHSSENDDWKKPRTYGKDAEDAPLGFRNPDTESRPFVARDQGAERAPRFARARNHDEPVSIPYTTAASEFLYGYNPICAALKAQRRQLYKIYLHPRVASRDGDTGVDSIRQLAEVANVEIKDVDDSWLRVMDKMSDGRPHNVSTKHLIVDEAQLTKATGLRARSLPPPPLACPLPRGRPEKRHRRRRLPSRPRQPVQ